LRENYLFDPDFLRLTPALLDTSFALFNPPNYLGFYLTILGPMAQFEAFATSPAHLAFGRKMTNSQVFGTIRYWNNSF
jgi:hypothetical protein